MYFEKLFFNIFTYNLEDLCLKSFNYKSFDNRDNFEGQSSEADLC